MTLPLVPNVCKVQWHWTIGDDTAATTVLHFKYSGGAPSGADCAAAATSFVSNIPAGTPDVMTPAVTFSGVTITDLSSMAEPHGTATAAVVGTRTGGHIPSGAAVLMNLGVARRYRGGKPRSYIPFGAATDLASTNKWSPSPLSGFKDAYVALVGAVLAHSSPITFTNQVNVGYFHGYTLGPAKPGGFQPKVPTPLGTPHVDNIISINASSTVGSQRRRNKR